MPTLKKHQADNPILQDVESRSFVSSTHRILLKNSTAGKEAARHDSISGVVQWKHIETEAEI